MRKLICLSLLVFLISSCAESILPTRKMAPPKSTVSPKKKTQATAKTENKKADVKSDKTKTEKKAQWVKIPGTQDQALKASNIKYQQLIEASPSGTAKKIQLKHIFTAPELKSEKNKKLSAQLRIYKLEDNELHALCGASNLEMAREIEIIFTHKLDDKAYQNTFSSQNDLICHRSDTNKEYISGLLIRHTEQGSKDKKVFYLNMSRKLTYNEEDRQNNPWVGNFKQVKNPAYKAADDNLKTIAVLRGFEYIVQVR